MSKSKEVKGVKEIWKDVPGFKDYQVSNLGNVLSKARIIIKSNGQNMTVKRRVLKPKLHSRNGYLNVNIYKNTVNHCFMIHQLVAMAFLDHKPNGNKMQVDHINEIKTDNRLSNLQVVSPRFNTSKSMKTRKKTSKYTGVSKEKKASKFVAHIRIDGKVFYLGMFKDEKKASWTYQIALSNYIDKGISPIFY